MDAIHSGDRIELQIQRRIQRVYQRALDRSTKDIAEFLQIVAKVDSGEKKPPAYYQTDEQKARWRQGFLEQEMQRLHVQELITEEIARAGAKAENIIREATADVYLDNYAETVNVIEDEAGKMGVNVSFAMPKRQEVRTLLDEKNGVFSKIAYRNMGSNTYIRQKLQSEMAQATILGESQKKIIQRIRNVTGQSVKQAKRVAQTERNRVQSQARYDAAEEAAKQGVETYNEWRCRFVRSRDTHMARHGVRVKQGECFPGCNLRYPGDINGSAAEVINCHCYLQVGVLLPGEKLNEDGSIGKAPKEQTGSSKLLQSALENDIIEVGNLSLRKAKFVSYSLDYDKAPDKARAFGEILGFTKANADELIRKVIDGTDEQKFVEGDTDRYGTRYAQVMCIKGANGRYANVLTAWIDDGVGKRLTSVYVTDKKVT